LDGIVRYAPLLTAATALAAVVLAWLAIGAQKEIARKRASVDFFLKSDLDSANLAASRMFEPDADIVTKAIGKGKTYADIQGMCQYKTVYEYMNTHELLTIGMNNGIFDEKICFEYWGAALVGHCGAAKEILIMTRNQSGNETAYVEVLELNERWKKQLAERAAKLARKTPA
jgi:hypothetical protein